MIWLFFTPFLLIGIVLLGLAVMKVTQHLAAQAWQPVQATLLERGVDNEKTSSGGDKIGGTSSLSGAFSYQWQGKRYESRQLSFSTAKTRSMGIDPDDWDARLDALLGEPGHAFTAWVNPKSPGEAVVLRDLRWLEIGAMVGFGLLLVWLSAVFLFGDDPHQATPGFSWVTVGVMWVVGALLAVLCPLLWRDGHPVWAVLAALPVTLAVYGTGYGLLQLRS
ncbi:MAG: DUF3592 domain-containing protein [Pseudomonadota bacterium]